MFTITAIILAGSFNLFTQPASATSCSGTFDTDALQARYSRGYNNEGDCHLYLFQQTRDLSTQKAMNLTFSANGMISAFLNVPSTGLEESARRLSQETGMHSYFVLPARDIPRLRQNSDSYQVFSASGQAWSFDSQGQFSSAQGCSAILNENIQLSSQTFQIDTCLNSLVIDLGFRQGGDNLAYRNSQAEVRDPQGTSCRIANHLLFNYAPGHRNGNNEPELNSEDVLSTVLSRHCPDLDISSLEQTQTPAPLRQIANSLPGRDVEFPSRRTIEQTRAQPELPDARIRPTRRPSSQIVEPNEDTPLTGGNHGRRARPRMHRIHGLSDRTDPRTYTRNALSGECAQLSIYNQYRCQDEWRAYGLPGPHGSGRQ